MAITWMPRDIAISFRPCVRKVVTSVSGSSVGASHRDLLQVVHHHQQPPAPGSGIQRLLHPAPHLVQRGVIAAGLHQDQPVRVDLHGIDQRARSAGCA